MRFRPFRRWAFAALATAIVVVAGLACGSGGGKEAPSTTATGPDAGPLVAQAADRMEQLRSFHFKITHEAGTTPITKGLLMVRADGDAAEPESLRADVDAVAPQLGGSAVEIEVISVGNVSKMTNPFDRTRWIDVPGVALQELFDPAAGTVAALREAKNATLAGRETAGGVPCSVVSAVVDGAALKAFASVADPGYTVAVTLWIGEEDTLVHRIRLAGPMGADDTPGVIRVVELSKFDEPVTIELPAG